MKSTQHFGKVTIEEFILSKVVDSRPLGRCFSTLLYRVAFQNISQHYLVGFGLQQVFLLATPFELYYMHCFWKNRYYLSEKGK